MALVAALALAPATSVAAQSERDAARIAAAGIETAATPTVDADEARRLLDRVDDLFRGDSSYGKARMSVATEHWRRTLELEFWSRGKDESLIRILAPAKEKGTATLRVATDLWNFLPKVKRVIKLPSSMMSAGWMGSHFTNDDLVKESRMADDYDVSIGFRGRREGQSAAVIEIVAIPKPDAAVVWGRVLVEIDAASELPTRIRYYDERDTLARTMTYHDVAVRGGRTLPTRLVMQPEDKPSESTIVEWLAIDFDVTIAADLFSLRTLQR